MNADIVFSVGVVVAWFAAVAVPVCLCHGTRGASRSRTEVLVKILSTGCLGRRDKACDGWGYRLQSFGDLACAFADAMNRGRTEVSHAESTSRRGCYKRPHCIGAGNSLTSHQVR